MRQLGGFLSLLQAHLRAISLLIVAVVAPSVWAEESYGSSKVSSHQLITLAAEDSWPPFANHLGQGISHRLIKAAFRQSNIEVSSLVVPYARALMMAEKGRVDGVFNVTREASTEGRFVFGQVPLFAATASFYQAKQRPLDADNKWQLPKGTVVGVIKSYEYGDEYPKLVQERELNLVTVSSDQQLINLLLLGRIDMALMFDAVANEHLQQMGIKGEIVPAFYNHTSDIYLAFSKKNPRATLLATALDQGLLHLKNSGQYQALLSTAPSAIR
ncbi:MAG: substrate-binding periplasmic protein [Shewanella sp.]